MAKTPSKTVRAPKPPRREKPSFDIFKRLRAVEPDPDGEHIWLLLDPPKDKRLH